MKLIYVSPLVDFQNGQYILDFVLQMRNGSIKTCQKVCRNHKEADRIHAELNGILERTQTITGFPPGVIVVDNESIYSV